MPASVFSGLALTDAGGVLEAICPQRIHDAARAARVARDFDLDIAIGGEAWKVRGTFARLKHFFAELNAFPPPYIEKIEGAQTTAPEVSCVVVVNENGPFVREQLVPSLMANSRRPIEIILVYNGAAPSDPALASLASLRSEWGAVAAAYNAGARHARGRYVALFHDDVVIDDPRWIDICVAALEQGAAAVAPEYRRLESIGGIASPPLPVAKCVPLVMETEQYGASGGFDEFHYVGYEDLDFSLSLVSRGLKLAAVRLALRHFSGMSSTLKYCSLPGLAELYAMTALPAAAIRRRFSEFVEKGVRLQGVDVMRIGLDVQLLYVLKKYRTYLAAPAYAAATAALERSLAAACPFDVTLALPRFRELDRAMRNAPG
jgi:glycosyltransferase involved in cell wall biosynthesis